MERWKEKVMDGADMFRDINPEEILGTYDRYGRDLHAPEYGDDDEGDDGYYGNSDDEFFGNLNSPLADWG